MASKTGTKRSGAVEELLDAIVKKKTFKQLAGYSVKCLQALLVPSRIGWEIQAKAAFELGGLASVTDVLLRYPTDAELLRFGLAACRAMVSVPNLPASATVDATTASQSVTLLNTLVADTSLSESDRATLTAEALEYNLALAKRTAGASADGGLLKTIGTISDRLAAAPKGGSPTSSDALARITLASVVFRLLYTLVSSREGTQTLANDHALLKRLLAAGRCLYEVGTATAKSSGGAAVSGSVGGRSLALSSGAGSTSAATGPAAPLVDALKLKAALDPLVRVLDRLSRVPEGHAALVSVSAGATLMPLADWWVHSIDEQAEAAALAGLGEGAEGAGAAGAKETSAAAASVMSPVSMLDLVNRLAGEGIQALMDSLSLGLDTGPAAKQQSARLLARLAELPDRCAALARDPSQAKAVVDLLQASVDALHDRGFGAPDQQEANVDSDASAGDMSTVLALILLTSRVAERGGLQSVLDAGGLRVCLAAIDTVPTASCPVPGLNVLHTAIAAAALRLVTYILSESADAETEYYGQACKPGDEYNRTAGEVVLTHGTVEGDKSVGFTNALVAFLLAPVDAAPDSSAYLAQVSRLAYACAAAREVAGLALGTAGYDAQEAAAQVGLVLTGAEIKAPAKAFLTAIGAAAATAARVAPVAAANLSSNAAGGGAGGGVGDRTLWAWLPKAACSLAVDAACAACASAPGSVALLEAGALAATVGILTGKAPPGSSAGGDKAKKSLVRQASGLNISGKVVSYSWVRGMMREEPAYWVNQGGTGARAEARTAAHALYLAASLTTPLAPYAQAANEGLDTLPASAGAPILTPAAISGIRAVAATSHHGQKKGAEGMTATVASRHAVDALLEACLSAYASHPTDGEVYASFKGVVETAGVSAGELVKAVDGLRAINGRIRKALTDSALVKAAVRTSAVGSTTTTVTSAYSTLSEVLAQTPVMGQIESNEDAGPNDQAEHKEDLEAEEAEVSASLPAGAGLCAQLGVLISLARQRLLLLEAVSLSPTLSWALVFLNGLHPLLTLTASMGAIAGILADLDPSMASKAEAGTGVTPAILAERLDDGLAHAATVFASLSRVAYEVRSTGAYGVDVDGDGKVEKAEQARIPAGLDRRILPDQLFGPVVRGALTGLVNTVSAAGLKIPLFIGAAVPLTGWLASAANARYAVGAPEGWQARYISGLLQAEFVEACVALLRQSMALVASASRAGGAGGAGKAGGAAGGSSQAAAASGLVTFDTVATVAANLQHVAVHEAGAMAVVQRGASRHLMRALPNLLTAVGSTPSGPAYRAVVAILNLLSCCVGAGDENAGEGAAAGSDSGDISVPRLLYKQGIVHSMLEVAFSGVGLGAQGGTSSEACSIALQIVSGVVGKRDVQSAVGTLAELASKASAGISTYTSLTHAEAEAWAAVASAGKGAAAPSVKHAVLDLGYSESDGGSAGSSGAGAGGEAGDHEGGSGAARASTSPLLAALQLVGLLITTRAGTKAGLEAVSSAVASCASLVRSAVGYTLSVGRVQEAVLGAVAALTASTDDKGPTPLPGPLSNAAQAAVAPPSKAERDLLWCVATACKVLRVACGAMRELTGANQAGAGHADVLALAVSKSRTVSTALTATVESLLSAVECAGSTSGGHAAVLGRLAAAAGGANLLGSSAGRPKAAAAGTSGGLPSAAFLQREALSTLSTLSAGSSHGSALVLGGLEGSGPSVVLSVLKEKELSGAGDKAGSGAGAGQGAGAGGASGSGSGSAAGGSGSGAGAAAGTGSTGLSKTDHIEMSCHVAAILAGVAKISSDAATTLVDGGATQLVLSLMAELVSAAVAASGPSASTASGAIPLAITLPGLAATLTCLAHIAQFPEQCEDMMAEGLPSFLKSTFVLLPHEETGVDSKPGSIDAARVALLRALAQLLAALALHGRVCCPEGVAAEDAGEEEEGAHCAVVRDGVVAVAAGVAAFAAAGNDPATVTGTLQLVLATATANATVPAGAAGRTLSALRADAMAVKLAAVAKRCMTSGGATQELLSIGRKAISLLQPKGQAVAMNAQSSEEEAASPGKMARADSAGFQAGAGSPSGPTGTPGPSAPATDELAELVDSVYTMVDDLNLAYGAYITAAAATSPDSALSVPPASLLEDIERRSETVLEGVRNFALVLGPRFPLRVNDEGTKLLTDAEISAVQELKRSIEEEEPTRATEWGAFATARHAVAGVSSWLCSATSPRFRPSARSISLAYDVLTASLPLISRLAAYTDEQRGVALAAYYAKTREEWELDPAHDVPIDQAVSCLTMALDSHHLPASALLEASSGTPSSASAYHPDGARLEPVARAVRVLALACGHETVQTLANTGTMASLMQLIVTLQRIKGSAEAGTLGEGGSGGGGAGGSGGAGKGGLDRQAARAIAAECERGVAVLSSAVSSIVTRAGEEITDKCGKGTEGAWTATEVLPAGAMADLLRAGAALAVVAAGADTPDEDESAETTDATGGKGGKKAPPPRSGIVVVEKPADPVLVQARTLVSSEGGLESAWKVLDAAAQKTLSAIELGTADSESAGSQDPRVNLRLFSGLLTAMSEQVSSSGGAANPDNTPPATASTVRALYATIATCMQVILGDEYTEAVRASSAAALGHDEAAEEYSNRDDTRKEDSDLSLWTAPPDAVKLEESSHSAETATVEEV